MRQVALWPLMLGFVVSLGFAAPAQAVLIGFNPSAQSVAQGSSFNVDLTISGLGDFAPDSLSTFDLDVMFDASILGLSSVSFGDPVLGDQLDLFGFGSITGATPGVGSVNLFQLSFDFPSDLDTLQASSFTLAVLTFDALALGSSALSAGINALGDSFGAPLAATVASASISVPEPLSALLLLVGLAGFWLFSRARQSQAQDRVAV